MITQELKQLWIAGLRSGSYQQGREVLRRNGRHCALGVLVDIEDQLTHRFRSEAMLMSDMAHIRTRIICMNDVQRYSFAEIADWIEVNILPDETTAPHEVDFQPPRYNFETFMTNVMAPVVAGPGDKEDDDDSGDEEVRQSSPIDCFA